jgi:hypothetical protein
MDTEWEIGYFLMSHAVALDEEYRIGHVMMCLSTKVRISKFRLRWFRHVVSVYVYVSGAVCGRTCATPEYSHDTDFSVSRAHRAIPRNTTSVLDEMRAARPAHDSPPVQMVGKVRRHAPCGGFEPIRLASTTGLLAHARGMTSADRGPRGLLPSPLPGWCAPIAFGTRVLIAWSEPLSWALLSC